MTRQVRAPSTVQSRRTPPESESLPAAIHVLAGVIRDVRGRVLLARRTAGRDLSGLWEFPGGKREAGESPEQALARELHEELGIRVQASEPLIAVPFAYRDKRIVLDVRVVGGWDGVPVGREKQALAWAPPAQLSTYPMPPADRPVVAALLQPDRYLITPEPGADDAAFLRALERSLAGGVTRVQLRAYTRGGQALRPLAAAVHAVCRAHGAELLLNGELALAAELGVGVHLRSSQLRELAARPLPRDRLVAASCHDAEELQKAQSLGVDFAVLGPVMATPSHPQQTSIGWAGFARLREQAALPIYALGGMAIADHAQARAHGAQGIAAIRGLWRG